jgi:anti-sigma-K factor RskA
LPSARPVTRYGRLAPFTEAPSSPSSYTSRVAKVSQPAAPVSTDEGEEALLDPEAVSRAYRFHRARRRARQKHHRERRWASLRFWVVVLLALAGAVFLASQTLGEIERVFGL